LHASSSTTIYVLLWTSKEYYNQEATEWLKCHSGRAATHHQVAGFFAKAHGKAATSQSALRGFARTATLPCNADIFSGFLLSPSERTTRPTNSETNQRSPPEFVPSTSSQTSRHSPAESVHSASEVTKHAVKPINGSCSGVKKRIHEGCKISTSSPCVSELKRKAAEKGRVREWGPEKRAKIQLAMLQ
jgi:hypothetical protein